MSSPDIAAALERWALAATRNEISEVYAAGNEMARLLRAANPPISSESSTEPFAEPTEADIELTSAYPGAPLVARPITRRGPIAEPATPAVGEDEALLARLGAIRLNFVNSTSGLMPGFYDSEAKWIGEAMSRLRALLAVVARLKQAFDAEEKRADLHANLNRRAAEALGKPQQGERSSWHDIPEDIAALRATIDAARKIAEEYDCKPNPCAAEILNVLNSNPNQR